MTVVNLLEIATGMLDNEMEAVIDVDGRLYPIVGLKKRTVIPKKGEATGREILIIKTASTPFPKKIATA